jgi:hypothetical protein
MAFQIQDDIIDLVALPRSGRTASDSGREEDHHLHPGDGEGA